VRAATARRRKELAALVSEAKAVLGPARRPDPHAFAGDPVGYAEEVLGIHTLTAEQKEILRLLHEPPCRVLVPSAHDVGKTFAAAVAACYWYDSFDPGLVLTTAPTEKDVIDLLWAEIRLLRRRAGLDLSDLAPSAPYMGTSPEHYAKGYVSRKHQGFQGRHRERMLFIFDEANDVDALHWTTTRTMADPDLGSAWLAIFNPTSTTSQAYQEDMATDEADGTPRWHRIRLSALAHPNVTAELAGRGKPVKGAVSLAMIDDWVREWCEPVTDPADRRATDIEWRPGSGYYFRPGPIFQARALGIWPDLGDGVWSPAVWEACVAGPDPGLPASGLPELGVDCATGKGDDYHAVHARWGPVSLHHETSNTMDPARIAARVRAVCGLMADLANGRRPQGAAPVRPQQVPVKIDDDGTGNALASFLGAAGYAVCPVGAGTLPQDRARYPLKRDELWFQVAARARAGLVYFGRLDRATRARLRQQLLAPAWGLDRAGRRQVETKDQTKEKIGRSPDDADAANLSHYEGGKFLAPSVLIDNPPRRRLDPSDREHSAARRRGLFGVR
jgi:hypothetical protein